MSRRRIIHPRNPHSDPASRTLVPLNPETVQAEWNRHREKALREIQVIRNRLEDFENEGVTLYQEWFHRSFPTELSESRALSSESEFLSRLIEAVRFECEWGGLSTWEAHEAVIDRHRRREPLISEKALRTERKFREAEEKRTHALEEEILNERSSPETFRQLREELVAFLYEEIGFRATMIPDEVLDEVVRKKLLGEPITMEDLFGEVPHFGDGSHATDGPAAKSPEDPPFSGSESELRSVYRSLAKRLHPDALGETLTEKEKRMWTEVQAAYSSGDLGRLLAIRAFLMEDEPLSGARETDPIGTLIREVFELRETLRGLRAEERRLAEDPAFSYFKKRNSEKLLHRFYRTIEESFALELARLREGLEDQRKILRRFARNPSKRTGPRSRTSSRS